MISIHRGDILTDDPNVTGPELNAKKRPEPRLSIPLLVKVPLSKVLLMRSTKVKFVFYKASTVRWTLSRLDKGSVMFWSLAGCLALYPGFVLGFEPLKSSRLCRTRAAIQFAMLLDSYAIDLTRK